jgi:predicted ATPase
MSPVSHPPASPARHPPAASLLASCDVVELSAAEDYRRRTLEGPAAAQLQLPLGNGAGGSAAPATAAAGPSAPAAAGREALEKGGGAGPGSERLYFWPLGPAAEAEMERAWARATGGSSGSSGSGGSGGGEQLPVLFGRRLAVPRAAGGAAWVRGARWGGSAPLARTRRPLRRCV